MIQRLALADSHLNPLSESPKWLPRLEVFSQVYQREMESLPDRKTTPAVIQAKKDRNSYLLLVCGAVYILSRLVNHL